MLTAFYIVVGLSLWLCLILVVALLVRESQLPRWLLCPGCGAWVPFSR